MNRPQGDGPRFPPRPAEGGFREAPRGFDDRGPPRERKPSPRFDITCQKCGVAATVPFRPIEGREIFCPTCYRARKGIAEDPNHRGRE